MKETLSHLTRDVRISLADSSSQVMQSSPRNYLKQLNAAKDPRALITAVWAFDAKEPKEVLKACRGQIKIIASPGPPFGPAQ